LLNVLLRAGLFALGVMLFTSAVLQRMPLIFDSTAIGRRGTPPK